MAVRPPHSGGRRACQGGGLQALYLAKCSRMKYKLERICFTQFIYLQIQKVVKSLLIRCFKNKINSWYHRPLQKNSRLDDVLKVLFRQKLMSALKLMQFELEAILVPIKNALRSSINLLGVFPGIRTTYLLWVGIIPYILSLHLDTIFNTVF